MPNEIDPKFDSAAFLAAIGPILSSRLGGDGRIGAVKTHSGTFNRVVRFTYEGRQIGARLPLIGRETRYERDVIKEVLAINLLNLAGQVMNDAAIKDVVEALLTEKRGENIGHNLVRNILYYDWSMTELPYPFFLFEWMEGTVLWELPTPENYRKAGILLAELHKVGFEHFYENVFTIHHVPRSWRDHIRLCLNRELARAEFNIPASLSQRFHDMDMSSLEPGRACLIHNDFSGANIIFDASGAAHAIDWDNWVVDCPELDLVKMKYWTAIGREGHLTHRGNLFEAFMDSYQAASGQKVNPSRMKAYEYLWLLRCFNFEQMRGAGTGLAHEPESWRQVYPDVQYYLDLLTEL